MNQRLQIPLRHFFTTPPSPCPYLPDRMERKVVTLLAGEDPNQLHEALSHAGFRRSQDLAYRPACENCTACIPVRVPVDEFHPTRGLRRIWQRHPHIQVRTLPPVALNEHFRLFQHYLSARHAGGGMADMNFSDYQAMVEESPVDSQILEMRESDGSLYAVCLTDRMADGLSLVYSFFDPERAATSPGKFVILWHIEAARTQGLEHVYLGYWIEESPKMAYKARFRPLEALGIEGWYRLTGA